MKRIIFILLLFISVSGIAQNQSLNWFNANKWGCYGDGVIVLASAAMTSGSPTLTITGGALTSRDIGKSVRVQGAGAANVDLISTITGFTSATVVTLANNAGATVSGRNVDYGTDNTPRIQAFFQFVVNVGGGNAFFPRGLYLIFGALQTSINSVNPNCQIYIPLTNVTSLPVSQLNISGEFSNQVLLPIVASGFANIQQKSTVFKSEIDGTGTNPSVFGTPYYLPSYSGAYYNLTSVRVENVIIEVKSQVNNVDVATTMCAFNANKINQFGILNAFIGVESVLYNIASLSSNANYGIIFPDFLNNAYSFCDRVTFAGFHWGFKASDHFDGGQVTSVFCWYALEYNNGTPGNALYRGHDAIIKHLQTELCPKGVNITGEGGLHVNLWSGERDASGLWYQTNGNDVDFTGSGVSGTLTVDALDMTNVGVPDYAISSNSYSRFKLLENNGRRVQDFIQPFSGSSTYTLNLIKGHNAIVILNQNSTLAITNATAGDKVTLEVGQDGTGGWTLTPADAATSNTASFTINPGASQGTRIDGFYDGAYWLWNMQNYAVLATGNPASTFVSALTSAGYTPGSTEAAGYATFYSSAVTHGYWSKLKVLYPFAGTSSATQKFNFVSTASYQIAFTGTNTFTSSGYTGNGSTGYGNTGFIPSTGVASGNSASFGIWTTTSTTPTFATAGSYVGTTGTTPDLQIGFNYDGTHSYASVSGSDNVLIVNNPSSYTGFFLADRTSSTLMTFYQNASSLGTATGATTVGLPSHAMMIGARNADNGTGGAAGNFSAQTYIFMVIADGLTSTEVTNLYADLGALKTAMGR